MKQTTKKYFDKVQTLFTKELDTFTDKFAAKVEVEIIDIAKRQRERFKDIQDQIKPSFSLNISLINRKKSRKVSFIFTDGTNIEDQHFNTLRFLVEALDQKKSTLFSIGEYFTHKGLPFEADPIFIFETEDKALEKIQQFITQIKVLLNQDDIKEALFSKGWITIPKDYSRYR